MLNLINAIFDLIKVIFRNIIDNTYKYSIKFISIAFGFYIALCVFTYVTNNISKTHLSVANTLNKLFFVDY